MSEQSIAVIGATGQVGRALQNELRVRGQAFEIAGRPTIDLADGNGVTGFLDAAKPRLVINAAAYTAVDRAEAEAEIAYRINADGPALLAAWCLKRGVPLIHMSTDYVFDGRKREPYREDDACNPLNVYGQSKLAGEERVRAGLPQHIIVRTGWVYGTNGQNFLKTMLRLGAERDVVRVVDDQYGAPTSAEFIASALLDIAAAIENPRRSGSWGTYHLAAAGMTTWHRFAKMIYSAAAQAGLKTPKLEAIATEDYPLPAARPPNGVLDTRKIRQTFGIVPPAWQDGVAPCVRASANERFEGVR